jgi:hypothetical protein
MLLIDRYPPGYISPPPPGYFRCAVRSCPVRLLHSGGGVCWAHDDVTPGDLRRDVESRRVFAWR